MKLFAAGALATLVSAAAAGPALAVPITTNPGPITGTGQSYAVYLFADAADQDRLSLLSFSGTALFDNKSSTVGSTVNLGIRVGTQTFTLNNLTTGVTFSTGIADTGAGGDGYYHARYSTNYASFGVGALSTTAANALAALPPGQSVLFVGFEDLRRGDYDYNDLIFAFVTQPTAVPEPASVLMLGLGLVGLGMVQMKRKRSA